MEIDTGASVTLISEAFWKEACQKADQPSEWQITDSKVTLSSYTGAAIEVKGQLNAIVWYKTQQVQLPILVVPGSGPNLLGRDLLNKIKLDWHQVFQVETGSSESEPKTRLDQLLRKYEECFKDELGCLQGMKAHIQVDPKATPRYHKARPVPYALRGKIEQELERLVEVGTIEPVQFAEWAAPIVPIVKEDKSIRICGDYKVTINQASKLDNYPIPKTEDLLTCLRGGDKFTKLDFSHAYNQLMLDEESKNAVTINTHKGLFRYNRLPYGVSSAPGIFQRTIENLLQGIPRVIARVDDVLLTGVDDDEHFQNLEEVLRRVQTAGLWLK